MRGLVPPARSSIRDTDRRKPGLDFGPAVLACALVITALGPAAALAQEPTPSEVTLARRLYREGLAHARRHRWDEAKAAFARSLTLAPRPATRLNLATAQLETGELVAAAENYRRYLQEAERERHRERARAVLAELEPRIPHVLLVIDGLAEDDRVVLDGEEISIAVLGEPLPVDPGAHTVEVHRAGTVLRTEALTLAEGERRDLSLRVPVAPTPREVALAAGDPAATEDEGSLFASPIFWAAAAAGAVAVAVILVLALGGGDPELGPRFEGNAGTIAVR